MNSALSSMDRVSSHPFNMKELYDSNTNPMQRIGLGKRSPEDGLYVYHESCGHTISLDFDFTDFQDWLDELVYGDHECGHCGEGIMAIHPPQPDTFDPF